MCVCVCICSCILDRDQSIILICFMSPEGNIWIKYQHMSRPWPMIWLCSQSQTKVPQLTFTHLA